MRGYRFPGDGGIGGQGNSYSIHQTGNVCHGSAKSNCSGGRNETSVRENNWRLMLIIKLSNESIRFSPVDGFSLSHPGVVVYKPSSFFHLLRTKLSTGRDFSSCLLGWTDEDGDCSVGMGAEGGFMVICSFLLVGSRGTALISPLW